MASFTTLASGSWRVQVRHKGRYVSESFQRREDARRRATEMEGRIDRGELATGRAGSPPSASSSVSLVTGHKDWKMLLRYTHLKRESLHDFAPRAA